MALEYWRREAIEKAVVELLDEYGVRQYPIDVLELAKSMQVPVIRYEDASADGRSLFELASKDAFSVNNHSFTDPKVILKGDVYPSSRAKFSLGHELGHIWLEHPYENELHEAEANYFSGYLLAPHPLIVRYGLLEKGLSSAFEIGAWSADIACSQAFDRLKRGPSKALDHELWLLENIDVKGCVAMKRPK